MKKPLQIIALLTLIPLSQVSIAADQPEHEKHHPAQKAENEMKMEGGMDMGMGMGMDETKMAEHLKMKQEHLLKMHDLSNKILAETDPKRKQELKDQQLELMKSHHMHMMKMHHMKMMQKHKM